MAANDKQFSFPTPSPWITVVIAVVAAFVAYMGASYQAGQKDATRDLKIAALEQYIADDKKTKEIERQAREARYQAAEAARNAEQVAKVEAMEKTNQALQAALLKIK